MKKIFKNILIVIAIIFVISLAACGLDTDTDTASDGTYIEETTTPTATDKNENAKNQELSKAEFKAIVDATVDEAFAGVGHNTEWDGNAFVVNVWQDGIALGATLAVAGDRDCSSAWKTMRANQVKMCETIMDTADAAGLEIDVIINLLNDTNTDNTLLTIFNGIVVYDVTD